MMDDRPPRLLPDGKRNPAYTKWYRSTPSGKAAMKRYADKPEVKARRRKVETSPATKIKKKEQFRKAFPTGRFICIECGQKFHGSSVLDRGWKIIGDHYCLCDLCDEFKN